MVPQWLVCVHGQWHTGWHFLIWYGVLFPVLLTPLQPGKHFSLLPLYKSPLLFFPLILRKQKIWPADKRIMSAYYVIGGDLRFPKALTSHSSTFLPLDRKRCSLTCTLQETCDNETPDSNFTFACSHFFLYLSIKSSTFCHWALTIFSMASSVISLPTAIEKCNEGRAEDWVTWNLASKYSHPTEYDQLGA